MKTCWCSSANRDPFGSILRGALILISSSFYAIADDSDQQKKPVEQTDRNVVAVSDVTVLDVDVHRGNVKDHDAGGEGPSKDVAQFKEMTLSGPRLRPGGKYVIALSAEKLGLEFAPRFKAKSCGCVTPTVEVAQDGTWLLKINIEIEPKTSSSEYRELVIFDFDEKELLPSGRESLRVQLKFSIDQPVYFEVDKKSLVYTSDEIKITGRWRDDFPIDGLRFDFGSSFDVSYIQSPPVAEDYEGFNWTATWTVKVKATTQDTPAFCRMVITDGQGVARASYGFASAAKMFDLLRPTLTRQDDLWVANMVLIATPGKTLSKENLKVTAKNAGISWQLSDRSNRVYDLRVEVENRDDSGSKLELKIEAEGTEQTVTLEYPPR